MVHTRQTPYDERADVQLRHLVERLVREGRSEYEIELAVHRATGSRVGRPRRLRRLRRR